MGAHAGVLAFEPAAAALVFFVQSDKPGRELHECEQQEQVGKAGILPGQAVFEAGTERSALEVTEALFDEHPPLVEARQLRRGGTLGWKRCRENPRFACRAGSAGYSAQEKPPFRTMGRHCSGGWDATIPVHGKPVTADRWDVEAAV